MEENGCPKTIEDNMRASDMLFLEYAIKKCALTLSKEEILSRAEQILTEYTEQQVNEILLEYRNKADTAQPAVTADPSPPAEEEPDGDNASLSARSRDAPAEMPLAQSEHNREKPKKKKSLFGDLLFYGVLIVLIVGTVILTGSGEQGPRSFAGFTAQTVLTSSMEDVYPKGALVVSRRTDPNTLEESDLYINSEAKQVYASLVNMKKNALMSRGVVGYSTMDDYWGLFSEVAYGKPDQVAVNLKSWSSKLDATIKEIEKEISSFS